MQLVCIGTNFSVEVADISIVASLSEMTENRFLVRAYKEGKMMAVRGSASVKSVVVLHNGIVVLTPLSAAKIRERVHAAQMMKFDS